jgi:hypothetical protein
MPVGKLSEKTMKAKRSGFLTTSSSTSLFRKHFTRRPALAVRCTQTRRVKVSNGPK